VWAWNDRRCEEKIVGATDTPEELVRHLDGLVRSGKFPSRAALARAVGATPPQMSDWLNRKVTPQRATVDNIRARLAEARGADDVDDSDGDDLDDNTGETVNQDESGLFTAFARLLIATDETCPQIAQKSDLHPALHDLFAGKSTPADLRHRAWGAVVWELAQLDGDGHAVEGLGELAAVLRGLREDGSPYRLGWASLQFKTVARADGSSRHIAGALIRTVGRLPEGVREPALMLLAGLCEPRFIVNLAVNSGSSTPEGPRTLALLRTDNAESAATNLDRALFGGGAGDRKRLHRALALYVFVAAKLLYDGLVSAQATDDDATLFARIRRHLGQHVPKPVYASPTPIRSDERGAVALWEQYTHIHVERSNGQDGPVGGSATALAHGGVANDTTPIPSLADQRRRLNQHLEAWRTTGLVDADAFIDTEVRYTCCELPDVRARWEPARLEDLAERFAAEVSEDATHSHLVCLVGPYGTGKTTIAQRLFAELHHENRDQWQILAWNPAKRLLEPQPVYGRDAVRAFKQHDISRVLAELGSEVTLHLSTAVPPGARLLVNASEMNAVALGGSGAQGATGGAGLQAIEALLREVTEKYLPTDVVAFVAMQAASLISEVGSFFSARPDLVMGRARLDSLWLVRGDCLQVRLSPGNEEDLVLRLIDERLPGCPTLNRILARRMSVPLSLKLEHLAGQLGADHIAGASGGALSSLQSFVRRASSVARVRARGRGDAVAPIDEYVPETGGLGLAMRQSVGTLVSTQAALWNGFQRQFLEMIRNEAELLQRSLGDVPIEGGGTGYAQVENLARSMWLESLRGVASSGLGLKSAASMGGRGVSLGAELPVTRDGRRIERTKNPGRKKKEVKVTPWHMAIGSTDDLDTAWYVTAGARRDGEAPPRWLLGVDIARRAPRHGAEHLRKKAGVAALLHIDPSASAAIATDGNLEKPRLVGVLAEKSDLPRLGFSARGLRVADVPQFLSALVLRIADRCTAPDETLSQWGGPGDEAQQSPCVADVWIDDDDSPDPRDWRVSRLFLALRERDLDTLARDLNGVAEWVSHILTKLEQNAERARGGPRTVLATRDVRRLVWEFERRHLHAASADWTPEDLLESMSDVPTPSEVAGLRVDDSGLIATTRNLPLQRIYADERAGRRVGLAIVAWENRPADDSAFARSFRPRKPYLLDEGADGVLELRRRGKKHSSEQPVVYSCAPADATLALFGPVTSDGDGSATAIVWFGPDRAKARPVNNPDLAPDA